MDMVRHDHIRMNFIPTFRTILFQKAKKQLRICGDLKETASPRCIGRYEESAVRSRIHGPTLSPSLWQGKITSVLVAPDIARSATVKEPGFSLASDCLEDRAFRPRGLHPVGHTA